MRHIFGRSSDIRSRWSATRSSRPCRRSIATGSPNPPRWCSWRPRTNTVGSTCPPPRAIRAGRSSTSSTTPASQSPERPGNKRVDGYLNILRNPHAGTVFLIPGRGDTLRVNGPARIVDDGDYFDELAVKGKRPILAVEIDVDEVFFHCAKAFMRSDLWKPDTWAPPDVLPSTAAITKLVLPEVDEEALEKRYSEENYRKILY